MLVAVVVVYRQLTDPERVRASAQRYLERLVGGEVTVGSARFALFGGITLSDVRIAEPVYQDEPNAPAHQDRADSRVELVERDVFHCSDIRLSHAPLAALTGRLVVDEVVAIRPVLSIYRDSASGRYNVSELLQPGSVERRDQSAALPAIRLRNARVRLGRREGGLRRSVEDLTLNVLAAPGADGRSYEVAWEGGGARRSGGRLLLDLGARTVTDLEGGLPWLTVEGAFLAAEARFEGADDWRELLGLSGQLQVREFYVSAGDTEAASPRATMELCDATVSLPLDDQERAVVPEERYLRFTEVNGRLDIGADDARARFSGRLHGSECHLDVRFTRGEQGGLTLEDIGFEGEVRVERFRFPARGDSERPAEARFVQRWRKLRHFYRDFDPQGTVNLSIKVAKAAGRDGAVRLEQARLESLDCDASYRMFPYRLKGLTGTVEYRPEGLRLADLSGEHAGGRVTVNGTLREPRWYTGGELQISGRNISIDRSLYEALSERYRRIWDRFELEGRADIEVGMVRVQGTAERTEPWRAVVNARFTDLNALYRGFRYPVEHITGELDIDPQAFTVRGLSGRCGDGRVTFNGWARVGGEGAHELDLHLEAADLSIDERLCGALPPEAARIVQRFDPQGRFDLAGDLKLGGGAGGMVHDLTASLKDARLTYEDLPVPVQGVVGDVRLTPRRVAVNGLEGRWGDTHITVEGSSDATGEAPETRLQVRCRGLRLHEELREVLPEDLRRVWSRIEVDGPLDTVTEFRQTGAGDGRRVEQVTRVTVDGADLTYGPLPLPLADVHGTVTISPGCVELTDLTGRSGDGVVSLAGELLRRPEGLSGSLRVTARGMQFSEELRAALPWRLRRTWNNLQPMGGFDLELPRLEFWVPAGEGEAWWDFDARLTLDDAGFDFGVKIANVTGSLSGGGGLGSSGLSLNGELSLERADVKGYRLTDLSGHLTRSPAEGNLTIEDLRGRLYGGSMTGDVEVNHGAGAARYACTTSLLNVELADLLNRDRPAGSGAIEVSGRCDAHLFISGEVGDPGSGQGGGRVTIEEARLFRLPLLLRVLNVLGLAAPAEGALQTASADFYLLGREVNLRDIVLRDPTVAMIGAGRLRGEAYDLDLRLIAVSPQRWFRLPVLTELLEGTARELVEIEVQGPLSDPQVTADPLPSVGGAVETLLSGRSGSGRD